MIIKENHFHRDGLYIGPNLDGMCEDVRVVSAPSNMIVPYSFHLRGDFKVEKEGTQLRVAGTMRVGGSVYLRGGCPLVETMLVEGDIQTDGGIYASKSIIAGGSIDAAGLFIRANHEISAGRKLSALKIAAGMGITAQEISAEELFAMTAITVDDSIKAHTITAGAKVKARRIDAHSITAAASTNKASAPSIFIEEPLPERTAVHLGKVKVAPPPIVRVDPEPEALTPDEIKLVRRLIGPLKEGVER